MEELNENSLKLRAYAGVNSAPVEIGQYGHDLSIHDELRAECVEKLKNIVNYIYEKTKPVVICGSALKTFINYATRAEKAKSEHPQVHELSKTMLVHLKVVSNPNQHVWARGVAVIEFMHAYKDLLDHPDARDFLRLLARGSHWPADVLTYMSELYNELTVCFERTPGYLLMPAKELSVYGLMMPTGVLVPRSEGLEFLRAYDLNRTRMHNVAEFTADVARLQDYLKSNNDPYRWLTWSMVSTKGDKMPGIWTGAVIVETLKKACKPEQIALGVLASRVALDYLASIGQLAETMRHIEGCDIPQGLLSSLTGTREEPGTDRWNKYHRQGARHLARVVHSMDVSSVALKLPVEFVLEARTCTISPNTVNSVADYVIEHISCENEIVLQTLLRDGWSGSFEELVAVANAL